MQLSSNQFYSGARLTYRPDIDGLRALAVLIVVGFHAFPAWLHGGFIGVDIFFVISGFLISTVIFRGLDHGSFSFVDFYGRRIKRIFPSLLLVLTVCFSIGWFVLLADEYGQLGKHIASGAGFVSNLVLWNENGYFDNASDTKPLLHLWSLGIEEQFYIFWPLTIWIAWKKKVNLFTCTVAVAFISFVLNIEKVGTDATAAFYSPQTRFWELLLGSALAYATLYTPGRFASLISTVDNFFEMFGSAKSPSPRGKTRRDVQSFLGALLIVAGVVALRTAKAFPGWWALLPSVGAALVISAGPQAWINHKILSNRVVVWFGLISFPLYLWHWPTLSFARILEAETPARGVRIAAVLASVVLAWATYYVVERPIRFGKRGAKTVFMLCAIMALLGYAGYNDYSRGGLAFRSVNKRWEGFVASTARSPRQSECFDISNAHNRPNDWFCRLNPASQDPIIFVFGDSHALNLLPAFEKVSVAQDANYLFTGFSGCPPLLGFAVNRGDQDIRNCDQLNKRVFEYVRLRKIKEIYLIGRWAYYTDTTKVSAPFSAALLQTLRSYSALGVKIHLVQDVPFQPANAKDLMRKVQNRVLKPENAIQEVSVTRRQHEAFQASINSVLRSTAQLYGVEVISLDSAYCNQSACPFASGGTSYYFDADHLSVAGSILATPYLFQVANRNPLGAHR